MANPAPNYANVAAATAAIIGGYQVLNTELPRIEAQLTDIQRSLARIEARTTRSESRLANERIKNRNTACYLVNGDAATLNPLFSLLSGDINTDELTSEDSKAPSHTLGPAEARPPQQGLGGRPCPV